MPPVSQRPHRLAGVLACLLVAAVGLAGCARNPAAQAQEGRSLLDQIKSVGVVKVGTRMDNPPHSGYDANGAWVGFDFSDTYFFSTQTLVVRKDEITRQGRIEVWPNG